MGQNFPPKHSFGFTINPNGSERNTIGPPGSTACTGWSPGGRIALSGILVGQEPSLLARYGAWFDALRVAVEGDWVRIDGVRRG